MIEYYDDADISWCMICFEIFFAFFIHVSHFIISTMKHFSHVRNFSPHVALHIIFISARLLCVMIKICIYMADISESDRIIHLDSLNV